MSSYDNGFARAQAAYDNAEPPGDYPYTCDDSGADSEDCTLEHEESDGVCPEREPCGDCGVIACRCDYLYEQHRERQWND